MDERYDVAIVGYGPVGQTAAILLGRLGHRVGVFERWPTLYPRPRAVHYDDEIARVFQHLGLAEQLAPITEPATSYEWRNAAGQTLLLLDRSEPGPSGWPGATMFSQPQLERLLDQTAKAVPGVEVHQGWEATGLHERDEHVRLTLRRCGAHGARLVPAGGERAVLADYVIGCDGANSFVRECMSTGVEDLGFAFDWLIADTVPSDPGLLAGVNLQRCDPERPTTLVSGGPGRRRWEWMLLPGETREQVEGADFVWSMLARSGLGEADLELERHTVYTFRARWAERWREGRLLLAGDAAHLMPPFAGQGMCSGIRDAFTLAWHLDLVLRGLADAATLDAYTTERRGHLRHAIALSVELGRVICTTDPAEAAARDEILLAAAADPAAQPIAPPAPLLGPGIREEAGPDGDPAGSLFPQGEVSIAGRRCLLEEQTGTGFALFVLGADPRAQLASDTLGFAERLGVSLIEVGAELDLRGAYRAWFAEHRCAAALVRPDFYVFGVAAEPAGADGLLRRLRAALAGQSTDDDGRPSR